MMGAALQSVAYDSNLQFYCAGLYWQRARY
jgi:hypothetical protein